MLANKINAKSIRLFKLMDFYVAIVLFSFKVSKRGYLSFFYIFNNILYYKRDQRRCLNMAQPTEVIIFSTYENFSIDAPELTFPQVQKFYLTNLFNIFIHVQDNEHGHSILYYQYEKTPLTFELHLNEDNETLTLIKEIPVTYFSNHPNNISAITLTLHLTIHDYKRICNHVDHCPLHLSLIKQ